MSFDHIYYRGKEVEADKDVSSGRLYVGIDEDGELKEKWLDSSKVSASLRQVPQMPKGFTGWTDSDGNIISAVDE